MNQDTTGRLRKNPWSSVIAILAIGAVLLVLFLILFPISCGCPHNGRKATCQINLVHIGKACKMYMGDWDDKLPTNRWRGIEQRRYLSNACRLSETDSQGVETKYSVNYVEALSPYIEKLEDSRSAQQIWVCPAASDKTYPTSWNAEAAKTTYCMNWYVAERTESEFAESGATLLFRELDRHAHALLRPHPSFPPDAKHPRGWGPPLHAFPTRNEFGTNDVEPGRHGEGSNLLFADGHVTSFLAWQLASPPVRDKRVVDGTIVGGESERWKVGSFLITP